MRLPTKRPDHINFDEPRGTNVSDFTQSLTGPTPDVTTEEWQTVRAHIERHGLWQTEVPDMLGLVDRGPMPAPLPPTGCPSGHRQTVHGGVRRDGRRYCRECNRLRARSGSVGQ